MRRSSAERGEGRLGCFLWILLLALIVYAGYKIVPVKFAASRFEDFMAEEAAFGSGKADPTIFRELLSKADELELPITKDQVSVVRTRDSITISSQYEVPVDAFFGQVHYDWKFEPVVERPLAAR